jgi:DNA-binding transcriptional ArsR family regulator
MKEGPDIARIASLIGDPARANMLIALMSGTALTASELAEEASITQQTASSHLRKLEDGGLLRVRKQGRHKYFALANEGVALSLEGLMQLAVGAGHLRSRIGPKDAALQEARVCYNHLAGRMGTRMFDCMVKNDYLRVEPGALTLTNKGRAFVSEFGIDAVNLLARRGPICRECLDWSERRSHLAGHLGRELLSRIEELGWASRDPHSRVVRFTAAGKSDFERAFA